MQLTLIVIPLVLATLMASSAQPPASPPPASAPAAPVNTPTDDANPARIADAEAHYPIDVTAKTLASPKALATLQSPGKVLFSDGFESADALKAAFEVLGLPEGRVKLTSRIKYAHSGSGALQLTAPANNGKSIGAGPTYWFGAEKDGGGQNRVYLRYYLKFADDYDQGNLNHTGASLAAVTGNNMWEGMGAAGIRPKGNDRFTVGFEPWRDWGRHEPPGVMHLYTYWMDMRRDRDGHFWGNMFIPEPAGRINPKRGEWRCYEQMIKANTPGQADGELAAWIDGKLYGHFTGFRWRTTPAVKLKRFSLSVYMHQSNRDNIVWYDDVVLSTGYVGSVAASAPAVQQPSAPTNEKPREHP
ncbi:MAG: hypothetical protein ACREJO_08590 [Phycisphaerales bacterium]